jgi:multiple sugar transport system substrate-binding protein
MDADEGFHMEDYRRNIVEGMRYKGGQYFMPIDFAFWYVSFNKDRLGGDVASALRGKDRFTYRELTDLVREQFAADVSDARVFDFQGEGDRPFHRIWQLNYGKYIDLENKKAHFTDSDFSEVLNEYREQRQSGYFQPIFSTTDEWLNDYRDSRHLYYYTYELDMSLKYSVFLPMADDTRRDSPSYHGPDQIVGLLTNDAGEAAYRNFQAYGMNANSQNKGLAWAFIKFMLREDMQQSSNIIGLPVNNAAYIDKAKLDLIHMPNYVFGENNSYTLEGFLENTDEKYVQAYEDYIACLNRFADSLDYFPATDSTVNAMVASEAALFLSGSKSAEDVADALQNMVQLYLDE